MAAISRFVSIADVHEGAQSEQVSVSVLFQAELHDGQSVLLLDDRGWNSSQPWAEASQEEIESTARVVVGPDEPYGDQTATGAVTAYWNYIQNILAQNGVEISPAVLPAIPHDVVLGQSIIERLGSKYSASE
ncbi:hypothetical protein NHF46_00135 [Arthrobacter alpinus]|uniref:Uncharacterized protein n=1 Tax=Arthrobacter alpinus TaxID=656366 RepID=A0A0S2M3J2_9MICC|nr:hypothetical protein [Arthrobacter alpinus]ALO68212.1 hypothetical protein AS189_19030 [Arthrobacter alpinus]MDD0856619.1 hypothetical protein [Arthrobacter alpinus]